jgi:uncharacterized protein YbjT (DUF2867 family)
MSNSSDFPILVLGATGKTGSRVAQNLSAKGLPVRRAARAGVDVVFDWNQPSSYAPALEGSASVYLVSPILRVDFAHDVSVFLDKAEQGGIKHVTYLSAYGMEHAPAEVALRAVELDIISRTSFTHSLIRPAWFMQDFSETFLKPVSDEIVVPNGAGTEAYVDVLDIAALAAETLAQPGRHAGRAYAPTGPEALTVGEAAAIISSAVGRTITYRDVDRDDWIRAMVASGIPAEYGEVVRTLTATVASGDGAQPNDDILTVTGSAPISFAEFAARTTAAWDSEAVR